MLLSVAHLQASNAVWQSYSLSGKPCNASSASLDERQYIPWRYISHFNGYSTVQQQLTLFQYVVRSKEVSLIFTWNFSSNLILSSIFSNPKSHRIWSIFSCTNFLISIFNSFHILSCRWYSSLSRFHPFLYCFLFHLFLARFHFLVNFFPTSFHFFLASFRFFNHSNQLA